MFAKLPEKRRPQKLKQKTQDRNNPETAPECFQVSVNILEARNLVWNTRSRSYYVVVTLGKEKYKTHAKNKSGEQCIGKEYLLFEWYSTLAELRKSKLTIAVMETRFYASSRLLGKAIIDLGVIWAEPNHQVFHKWARLYSPRHKTCSTVSLLKLDVSIMCRGNVQFIPDKISEPAKEEIKCCPPASEQQPANYTISVYNAFGLTTKRGTNTSCSQQKPPNTFVKVSFCGISVKTETRARSLNPTYNQQISIADVFPNTCRKVRLEVCSAGQGSNAVLGCVDLHLDNISYDGENGFIPTFGPSLLYMYGSSSSECEITRGEGAFYKGALLVALKVMVPYVQQTTKQSISSVDNIKPLSLEKLWAWEDYVIYCPILEVSMLDRHLAIKNCGVAFTIGEIPCQCSENDDFASLKAEIKRRKFHYTGPIQISKSKDTYGYLYFTNAFPVLQHAMRLPAFRYRIYRSNLVQKIAKNLEKSLHDIENRLNNCEYLNPREVLDDLNHAVDVAAEQILKFLDNVHLFNPCAENHYDYSTELDQKQLALQKEELKKIYQQIKEKIDFRSTANILRVIGKMFRGSSCISKKNVKILIEESITFGQKLKSLVFKTAKGWPDIVIWLLSEGSRFAFHKISTSDVIFSDVPELSGKDCGRIQTVYMKPIKCPKHINAKTCTCIAGKVELLIWMGLHSKVSSLNKFIPEGYCFKGKDSDMCLKAPIMMVKCRVYIYRAKFINFECPNSFVRINVLNSSKITQIQDKTSAPVWDQVLKISSMIRITKERLTTSPPEILVEVYHHTSKGKLETIGRAKIQPSTDSNFCNECPPKLEWHDLRDGLEIPGQILMSSFIQMIPEKLVKSTIYSSLNEVSGTLNSHSQCLDDDEIEEIPLCIKPKFSIYKVDVYWWGLRDVAVTKKTCAVLEIDELVVKSDVITESKPNCNFPNGRISKIIEGNLENTYSSRVIIKLCDSSTFGRIIFFGTRAEKNPSKYLVDWLPKSEREKSLAASSILSSDFRKVNESLYVKNSNSSGGASSVFNKVKYRNFFDCKKLFPIRKIFCATKSDKKKFGDPLKSDMFHKCLCEEKQPDMKCQDWWSRFYSSQKDQFEDFGGKIKIYNSELEQQPEFEKFKDWVNSVKLYKGQKTGMSQKDKELCCGTLKVGIAIYRWPPPLRSVAVNYCGVELQCGYFNDFPCNDQCKLLIRVYIVRGLNLVPKDCCDKCNPYVIVKCGKKQYGDRSLCLENTTNPIFGRTFEFHCSLPEDYLLNVSLYNHDEMVQDPLIGSTEIDIENRFYSNHRGRVGLSTEYKVTGVAKWRDFEKPSDILVKLCAKNNIPPPVFNGNSVTVNGVEYRDSDQSNKTCISAYERRENLCLNLLHKWNTLPLCGYHLVPEHVETRSLRKPDKPSVIQGKILMWVDIFPLKSGIYLPVPVDITPRKVDQYELRVIVWNIQNLYHESMTKKKGTNLYVKAWIGTVEQALFTDVHYNSMKGEASFNWRMIFNFKYQQSDRKLLMMEKDPFTEFDERLPPILVVEVLDSDAESPDDYLAVLTLDLNAIPMSIKQLEKNAQFHEDCAKNVNLFSAGFLRSCWPLKTVDSSTGNVKLQGLIELELQLLSKEKAMLCPVGLGRDAPSPLPVPNRSDPRKLECENESLFQRFAEYVVLVGIILVIAYAIIPELSFSTCNLKPC